MKVGTFFSGIGSPEQALLNLGINHEIEFACDIDKYARETYLKNFNCKNMYEDITALDMKNLSYVDLLVFGFPCQAFSMAGKRGGFEDTRGTLFYDALRYLKEHKPRYFIAENVKGLLSHDNGKTFQTIIDCLALTTNTQMSLMPFDNLGYHIHYKVLNTKDFGIPQNRERIFIVGIRDDADNNFRFPKEMLLEIKLKDLLQINVDDKYYLSNKAVLKIKRHNNSSLNNNVSNCIHSGYYKGGGRDQQYIKTHSLYPRSSKTNKGGTGHLSKSDGTSYCIDTGNAQAIEINSVAIRDKNRAKHQLNKNKNYGDYQKDYQIEERKDNLSYCVKQSVNEFMIKNNFNNKIRRLTPIECERLQGFPDNHTEGVSDTQRYKQCGNSITVNVMEAILKNLLNGHS
jgi:DNA (cytosine-5)-methyltransferase 1